MADAFNAYTCYVCILCVQDYHSHHSFQPRYLRIGQPKRMRDPFLSPISLQIATLATYPAPSPRHRLSYKERKEKEEDRRKTPNLMHETKLSIPRPPTITISRRRRRRRRHVTSPIPPVTLGALPGGRDTRSTIILLLFHLGRWASVSSPACPTSWWDSWGCIGGDFGGRA